MKSIDDERRELLAERLEQLPINLTQLTKLDLDLIIAALRVQAPVVTEEDIARTLVPFALREFEDQERHPNGGAWKQPPLTPNARARKAAQTILALFAR